MSQPYMPVFVGDHLRDTRLLSLAARGAYMDIRCMMWDSVITGVITVDTTDLCRLLGCSYNEIDVLLGELLERGVFKKEAGSRKDKFELHSPDMIAQAAKSRQKAASGKKGMESRYKKNNPVSSSVITDDITTAITNPGIGIGNRNVIDNEGKGGTGENFNAQFENGSMLNGEENSKNVLEHNPNVRTESILTLSDCLEVYLLHPVCKDAREVLCRNRQEFMLKGDGGEILGLNIDRMRRWGEAFNQVLKKQTIVSRSLGEWANHFFNWVAKQNLKQEPEKIFENGNRLTGTNGNAAGPAQKVNGKGASVTDIQALKRDTGANTAEPAEFAHVEVVKQ